ncbi:SsrA-binding protein SmpB [Oceanivirga miroungae]|uniref:SsrA-binding protein n=1 Tax=Oceanivirga miroungae TaxID=1130046 RepID=A0A6I8MD99_9FUSO|nr:SsrA-binding protein SmpB [Oceanivirga miroungae]VWL85070.1 SsrA-binding protein [Oceanivirga miroungae]
MVFATNKKASFDYFLLEKYEVGINLVGTEVKSVRKSKLSIKESYVKIIKDELYILNMHISPYEFGNINNVEETRTRKLLMKKKEIRKLKEKIKEKGLTLVPVKVYSSGRYVKLEIALSKGKKNYDKRQSLKEKDIKREIRSKLNV